jgi:hypothetical protein
MRPDERWVRRLPRLRKVRRSEHVVRREQVRLPAARLRRARRGVRRGPVRLRRYIQVHGLPCEPALLRWRRSQPLRLEGVSSADVRGPWARLRNGERRLRKHPRLRRLSETELLRRRRSRKPLRLHAEDVRPSRMAMRKGQRRLRKHTRLRRMPLEPDLQRESPMRRVLRRLLHQPRLAMRLGPQRLRGRSHVSRLPGRVPVHAPAHLRRLSPTRANGSFAQRTARAPDCSGQALMASTELGPALFHRRAAPVTTTGSRCVAGAHEPFARSSYLPMDARQGEA